MYSRCRGGAEREREKMRELATTIDFLKGHPERERKREYCQR